ncbi:autotransporter [Streptomyces sp. 6N223]|uniref:autotransporter n=1 Tax=Streptomyces sp. 6N223 TaxID=3457412 RepID=UPI003FD429D0
MRRFLRAGAVLALLLAALAPPSLLTAARADDAHDITADIRDGRDVVLAGDAVVRLADGETTTYDGVISGVGTLRVTGGGTLILTRDSDFEIPEERQRQSVSVQGGNHPYTTVSDPDPPAVIVDPGATLQYGTGGTTGLIGHFPYATPGFRLNQNNIQVDGTLRLSLTTSFNLGTISGSGLVTQPRFLWGTLELAGTHPFSGVIDNGTGTAAGRPEFPVALPGARAILNQGTWTVDTPLGQTITLNQDFYQREYGSDINVQSRPGSRVVLGGTYSYSDTGGDTDPSLSDPALNWTPIDHDLNKRGTNIKGADVQWGDGTTSEIFMPGTAETVYINLLEANGVRSGLTFAYNGPVTLGAPIGGGVFHDTLAAPGQGDIVIASIPGNDVTFAAHQYYDGATTVERGAVLRLGTGEAGGDGGLMTDGAHSEVVLDGRLVAQNADEPVTLSRVSGSGSLTQDGPAGTVLAGEVSYTGRTTIARGTLTLSAGSLSRSSGVRLTSADATLDLRQAGGDQTLQHLTATEGAAILLAPDATLTVEGKPVGLSTDTITLDGTPYAVHHTADRIRLTALPPEATAPEPSASPSATASPKPTPTDDAATPAPDPTPAADALSASDAPPAWRYPAAGAALGLVVVAIAASWLLRRQRS